MKSIKHHAKNIRSHRHFSKVAIFAVIFAAIGTFTVLRVVAATPTVHFETEQASLSSASLSVTDNTASGGRSILFGDSAMPPQGGFVIDPASLPQNLPNRDPGSSSRDIRAATYLPRRESSDPTAAFRTNCKISHASNADPIVAPGGSVMHLHAFYGNMGTDAHSTPTSIQTTGNTTCTGGIANRSSYWAPAMLDTTGGEPYRVVPHHICTSTYTSACELDADNALQVYYKSGYDGVLAERELYSYTVNPTTGWTARDIQNFPDGLRMISGNLMSTAPQPGIIRYNCAIGPGSDGGVSQVGATIPNCSANQLLVMSITFPQCWDGVNLDSPNHKSHMSFGAGWPDRGCPTSHPIPLPQVTQNFRWRVPAAGMANWKLSSDMNSSVPIGYSGHADWMNGWDRTVFQQVIDNCYLVGYASGGLNNCIMNLLGEVGAPGLQDNQMLF